MRTVVGIVSISLKSFVDFLSSRWLFLMLICRFDGTLSFNNPLNVISRIVQLIRSGISSHFNDTMPPVERYFPF